MRPLTPVRRTRYPVELPGGHQVLVLPTWELPQVRGGVPGAVLIHRPGGWRSVVALVRLFWTAVRR